MPTIRKKAADGLHTGDTFSVSRTFTEQDVVQFAALSRDYNPVHFDERFAAVKNFDGRICHGLLIGSLITEIGGQIGWLASGMQFKFIKPVYFGDTITCNFTITELDARGRAKAEVIFRNDHDVIVQECALTGVVPGTREKRVLNAMLAEGDPTNHASG